VWEHLHRVRRLIFGISSRCRMSDGRGPDYGPNSSSVKSGDGCTAHLLRDLLDSTRLATLPLDRSPSPSSRLLADRRGRDSSLVVGPLTFLLGGPSHLRLSTPVGPSIPRARGGIPRESHLSPESARVHVQHPAVPRLPFEDGWLFFLSLLK